MIAKAKIYRDTVIIYYDHDRKTLRIATQTGKIPSGAKMFKDGQLTAKVPGYKEKNKIINIILSKVNDIISDFYFTYKEKPSVEFIKSALKQSKQKVKSQDLKYDSFEDLYLMMFEEKKCDAIVPSSLKDYTSTLNSLRLYQHLNGKLTLELMNSAKFIKKFESFLGIMHTDEELKIYRTKGGLNVNTTKKRISTLLTFLKWCEGQGAITRKFEVVNYKTKLKKYQPTVVIITREEKEHLLQLRLAGTEEELRDILVFLCLTGLRYSDLLTLNKGFYQNGYIVKDAQKTKKKFKVPLTNKAKEIAEKYNYKMNMFSTTIFNKLIKELLKKHSICCYPISIQTTVFTNTTQEQVEKWTQICSHTGRRSFVANCIMTGHTIPEIMAMTGHSRISSLQCYIDQFQIQQQELNKIQLLD
jgi:integrase